jgi:hypothetical protein
MNDDKDTKPTEEITDGIGEEELAAMGPGPDAPEGIGK